MTNGSTDHFWNLDLSEQQEHVRLTAREFAEQEIRPRIMEFDESQTFPTHIFRTLGEMGFLGMIFPEEYEGAGLGYVEYALVIEEISRVDPSVGLGIAAHNGLCASHINLFGTEEQKRTWLPDLASGRKLGMWGLTEPGSGSDAGGMRTNAVRDGDEYVLNGSKNFITHASVGQTAVIMAKTDPGAGNAGISAFIVDKDTPGFHTGKKENKLGMRASDTAGLILDNVRIPVHQRLGDEGIGFKQALQVLDRGRIAIAALSVGLAQGAYETALEYSKQRKQFGKPIAEFQATQFKLADLALSIEASRMMVMKAATMKDAGLDVNIESARAKLFASETAVRASNEAVQILGGYGFSKEYPAEKFYRDVKLLTIGEGTSEIQRMVISRALLKE